MTPLPRRRFLGQLATVTLATGLLSRRVAAQSVPEAEILGQGDFRYRVQKDWGRVEGRTVKDCHAMVQDRKGRLYLAQTDNGATSSNILVYDRSGKPIEAWGKDYPGAHGLVISEEGGEEFLYITDTSRKQVIKTTLDGKVLLTVGRPKGGVYANAKAGFTPTDVAIAPNGDLYVMDGYASSVITRFNAKGEIQLEKKDDMKKRGLASPDIADALALTFALPVTAGWDLPPVQEYCVTEYDLYRDFTDEYWDEKDEFDS